MKIPVLVEPQANGFRATTSSPVALSAEGNSEQDAVSALRKAFAARLQAGGRIVDMDVSWIDLANQAAKEVGKSPGFEEYLKAIEEHRLTANAIPDVPQ